MSTNPIIEDFKRKSKNYYNDIYKKGKDPKRIVRLNETDNILKGLEMKNRKVLDAGSGPAVLHDLINNHGGDYYALDLSPDNINEAKIRIPGIKAYTGSLEETLFEDNTFDFIISLGCLEYIENTRKVITEFSRIVKPGGLIICSFANKKSPSRLWEEYVMMPIYRFKKSLKQGKTYRRHLHTNGQINVLFEKNGFKRISIHYINFSLFGYPFTSFKIIEKLNRKLNAPVISRFSSEFICVYRKL